MFLRRHCHTHNRRTEGGHFFYIIYFLFLLNRGKELSPQELQSSNGGSHYPGQSQAKCLVQQHKQIFLRWPCRDSNPLPPNSESSTL